MATIVLPGDTVSSSTTGLLKLGPGLSSTSSDSSSIIASRAGRLGHHTTQTKEGSATSRWIESEAKRYTPSLGEPVVGVVIARHAEGYRVDIGGPHMATLDALAFEGATKRSKPNLKIGAIVYARVTLAQAFAEPEIECVDQTTQKSQGFGELTEGFLVRSLELGRCRSLLSPSDPLLPSLGARFPFEVAIGMNGRAWVKSIDVNRTVELVKAVRGVD